jgi:hypothetical protein
MPNICLFYELLFFREVHLCQFVGSHTYGKRHEGWTGEANPRGKKSGCRSDSRLWVFFDRGKSCCNTSLCASRATSGWFWLA